MLGDVGRCTHLQPLVELFLDIHRAHLRPLIPPPLGPADDTVNVAELELPRGAHVPAIKDAAELIIGVLESEVLDDPHEISLEQMALVRLVPISEQVGRAHLPRATRGQGAWYVSPRKGRLGGGAHDQGK